MGLRDSRIEAVRPCAGPCSMAAATGAAGFDTHPRTARATRRTSSISHLGIRFTIR